MKTYAVSQAGRPLATRVAVANSFFTRVRGLMLRKTLAPGEGLLLKNCSIFFRELFSPFLSCRRFSTRKNTVYSNTILSPFLSSNLRKTAYGFFI